MKQYSMTNVYEAACKRMEFIFDEFENIVVSFSGGKDSGVVLNMAIDEARKRGRKIGAVFIDLEAWYQKSEEYIRRMFEKNLDVLEPMWICLPMESPNSLSYLEPTWIWWDQEKRDLWVRPMPDNPWVINEENNPISFYRKNMTFEEFVIHFADWWGHGEKTASLLGLRADESLNRYRAVTSGKKTYRGLSYSTLVKNQTYNFYPIYDWGTEDIWIYNGKFQKDYNALYDLFFYSGVSIHKMRVDEPFGNEAKAGLNLFRVIEPDTWARVVNRVSGANFGNIYHGQRIMSSSYKLPKNHTWKSFTMFLLDTLPEETANNYRTKFRKFTEYWMKTGCPMKVEHVDILENKYPEFIVNTHSPGNRGKGDKELIKFTGIPDEIPGVDNQDDALSWKRMCMCIIKNDWVCKSLSFSITKDMREKRARVLEKYKNL